MRAVNREDYREIDTNDSGGGLAEEFRTGSRDFEDGALGRE